MKLSKILFLISLSILTSCQKYDDTAILRRLEIIEKKTADLEALTKKTNEDLKNLQSLIESIVETDVVTRIDTLTDSYCFEFLSGKKFNIDKPKVTLRPDISVKLDKDGVYYWYVNDKWLLFDDGEKVPAATIVPKYQIEDEDWYISLDEGMTWRKMGNVEEAKPAFDDLYIKNGYLYFNLDANEEDVLKIRIDQDRNDHLYLSFNGSCTLGEGESLRLLRCHIQKNILLSATIEGEIQSVSIGNGFSANENHEFREYSATWIELCSDKVMFLSYYNNGWKTDSVVAHGLTLTNRTTVVIQNNIGNENKSTLAIYDDLGNVFTHELDDWGVGQAFITNNGQNSIDARLSFMPRDITKSVWCFGDSYFSFTNKARWVYHARQDGNINWLSDNQPGINPKNAYTDLCNMLSLGYRPKFVLWAQGMNGETKENKNNGQYVINSYQKQYVDAVKAICDQNGIIPVFCCIPSVPNRNKCGFSSYIRSLGTRYIDIEEAVGADEKGIWNPGLLSSDNVHPTEKGAKVIYSKVLVDFPEIAVCE